MKKFITELLDLLICFFFVVLLVFKLANLVDISWAIFIGIFVLNVVGYAFYKLCVAIIKHSIKKDIEWLSKYQEK